MGPKYCVCVGGGGGAGGGFSPNSKSSVFLPLAKFVITIIYTVVLSCHNNYNCNNKDSLWIT